MLAGATKALIACGATERRRDLWLPQIACSRVLAAMAIAGSVRQHRRVRSAAERQGDGSYALDGRSAMPERRTGSLGLIACKPLEDA